MHGSNCYYFYSCVRFLYVQILSTKFTSQRKQKNGEIVSIEYNGDVYYPTELYFASNTEFILGDKICEKPNLILPRAYYSFENNEDNEHEAKTFTKNTGYWYYISFSYSGSAVCPNSNIIIGNYDGKYYLSTDISDYTFTGVPIKNEQLTHLLDLM